MATSTVLTNKPINPRGDDNRPVDSYNKAKLYSGKALDFDGVNDFISTGTQTAFDMKSIAFHFIGVIDSNLNGFVMHANDAEYNKGVMIGHYTGTIADECLSIGDGTNHTTTKETFDDGIHFAVFSWDATNSKYKIFVNGVELTTENNGADSGLISGITSPVFGKRAPLNDFYLNGGLSNIRLFDVSLTAAQVADLYNNPEKIVPTGVADSALKLWLPMMEGAGNRAYDGSGNGNHGTISGATWTHGIGSPVAQTAVIDWNKGTNLLKLSEQLNESTHWGRTNVDVTEDDETAPDGQSTAELIKDTTTTGAHYINASVTTAASTTYVQSVWVKKKDDGIYAGIRTNGVGSNSYIIFDFDTATIVATGSDIISKGVETYSNGWYRIYMTYTLAPTGAIYSVTNSSSSVIASYAGTGKGYYIWGAQVEASDSLTAYIPNHTAVAITSDVLLPQGLTSGRDITGVNLFENVRKQGALNLDGKSWAEVHDNASLDFGTGSFTLEAWAKFSYVAQGSSLNAILTLGGDTGELNQGRAALVSLLGSKMSFYYNASSHSSTSTFSDGDWVHLVGVYDETNAIVYINGAEESTTARTASSITNTDVKMIGRDSIATRYYNDQIAQPRIYNRALTASEVLNNYNSTKAQFQ